MVLRTLLWSNGVPDYELSSHISARAVLRECTSQIALWCPCSCRHSLSRRIIVTLLRHKAVLAMQYSLLSLDATACAPQLSEWLDMLHSALAFAFAIAALMNFF